VSGSQPLHEPSQRRPLEPELVPPVVLAPPVMFAPPVAFDPPAALEPPVVAPVVAPVPAVAPGAVGSSHVSVSSYDIERPAQAESERTRTASNE
jgi:hypothetical protein